jgi:hypothetical protein
MNEQFANHLRVTVPSCLRGFRVTKATLPEAWDDNPCSVWRIACACGSAEGRFLGYSLHDYTADDGLECFISPLAFECKRCQTVTELLDTDLHGYHAEIARRIGEEGSTKLRGEGPRKPYPCPNCGSEFHCVLAAFVFWNANELEEEYDSGWEDLFNVFLCYCTCAGCGRRFQPTEFGKL